MEQVKRDSKLQGQADDDGSGFFQETSVVLFDPTSQPSQFPTTAAQTELPTPALQVAALLGCPGLPVI